MSSADAATRSRIATSIIAIRLIEPADIRIEIGKDDCTGGVGAARHLLLVHRHEMVAPLVDKVELFQRPVGCRIWREMQRPAHLG